jgi:hypothetical protein
MNAETQLDLFTPPADIQAVRGKRQESRLAAQKVDANVRRKTRDQVRILRCLEHGNGPTDEKIQEDTGLRGNTERPRRGELEAEGLIYSTKGGRTRAGNKALRWWLTQAGIDEVDRWHGVRFTEPNRRGQGAGGAGSHETGLLGADEEGR